MRYISIISLLHAFNCKLKIYDNADKITTHTPSNKSKWLKQTFGILRFGLALPTKTSDSREGRDIQVNSLSLEKNKLLSAVEFTHPGHVHS